jgi:magnesium transporter
MIKKYELGKITWIDLAQPSKDDFAEVIQQAGLHPLIAEEIRTPSVRSKIDLFGDLIYLTLHFPPIRNSYDEGIGLPDAQEVDFVIGHNLIITVHYDHIESLTRAHRTISAQATIASKKNDLNAGLLFFFIIRELYQSLETGLDYINSSLKRAEKGIFAGEEIKTVKLLSDINRNLLDFKWSLKHHREILASLETAYHSLFDDKFNYYMKSIVGEFDRIWALLESHRETFNDLRRTNDSLLAIKTSEATKTLTAIAFFTFTLSTLAAIFSMNMRHNPFLNLNYDYWIVIGIMAIITTGVFIIFRSKKWL